MPLRYFPGHYCLHSLAPIHGRPSLRPNALKTRHASWKALLNLKPRHPDPEETSTGNDEEEQAKAAILDKVMKGRLPADLMLRCSFPWRHSLEYDF